MPRTANTCAAMLHFEAHSPMVLHIMVGLRFFHLRYIPPGRDHTVWLARAVAHDQHGLWYLHFCFGESYLVLAARKGFSFLDPAPRALDSHQLEVCLLGLLWHSGQGCCGKGLFEHRHASRRENLPVKRSPVTWWVALRCLLKAAGDQVLGGEVLSPWRKLITKLSLPNAGYMLGMAGAFEDTCRYQDGVV